MNDAGDRLLWVVTRGLDPTGGAINDRGCSKWGRRIGRQSLKEGWYVQVYVLLVRVCRMYGWHDHVTVWLVHRSLCLVVGR